jgi:hypothetical protein
MRYNMQEVFGLFQRTIGNFKGERDTERGLKNKAVY